MSGTPLLLLGRPGSRTRCGRCGLSLRVYWEPYWHRCPDQFKPHFPRWLSPAERRKWRWFHPVRFTTLWISRKRARLMFRSAAVVGATKDRVCILVMGSAATMDSIVAKVRFHPKEERLPW